MKTKLFVLCGLFSACATFGQTSPPVFSNATADAAGAIRLQWASQSNLVYRIEYATDLVDSNTQWQPLYADFPSQGTNTIWKDAGGNAEFSRVPHPNDVAQRFYRVVVAGTNSAAQTQVNIVSPATNSILSDFITVTVSVTSSLSPQSIRLFVDGQEAATQLYPETNFVINTAQFPNGAHKLFAVAEAIDGAETTLEPSNMVDDFIASPYREVTFDNFISDFRGSALFVETADGETITFKANFAAYADWTLAISNSTGVFVRTVTGTGNNMAFVWDGRDDSRNDLPVDFYSPTLSAAISTNGPAAPAPSTNPPPPSASGESAQNAFSENNSGSEDAWFPTDLGGAILGGWDHWLTPPPPLPPELEKEIGPLPWVSVPVPKESASPGTIKGSKLQPSGENSAEPEADGPEPNGGATRLIPPRIAHSFGTMALAYQGHHPAQNFGNNNRPSNGLGGRVTLNGTNVVTGAFGPLRSPQRIFMEFQGTMERKGFRFKWGRADDNLTASMLRGPQYGGSNQFNTANIGLLVGHGVFGTTGDFTISASGPLETYFPIYHTGVNSYDWVRFTQFQFGADGSSLRWMGILSCNNMFGDNYDDMYNKEALPIGDNLHLLLGASSTVYLVSNFGQQYASALTGADGVQRRSVLESWFFAGRKSQEFQTSNPKRAVRFRVAGWPACFNDDVINYSEPDSGNPADITFDDRQVYP